MSDIPYPLRINRYLALKGLVTRRDADKLIAAGSVRLNGKKAKLGDRVEASDTVEVVRGGRASREYAYVAYYKPRGVITHSPQGDERSIGEISGFSGLFPIGRLDKASEGLIILTDDGRITDRLLHPRFAHEKEYVVTVREKIRSDAPKILEAGVINDGERLTAKKVEISSTHTLKIVLTEGKKHQVRRMLDVVHLTVERLVRTRIMGVHLGALRPGEGRTLHGLAKKSFLKGLTLDVVA